MFVLKVREFCFVSGIIFLFVKNVREFYFFKILNATNEIVNFLGSFSRPKPHPIVAGYKSIIFSCNYKLQDVNIGSYVIYYAFGEKYESQGRVKENCMCKTLYYKILSVMRTC